MGRRPWAAAGRLRSWEQRRCEERRGENLGKQGPKQGSQAGHRVLRESRGPVASRAQTEPASAIYFRDLKPVSGSQDGLPGTTDIEGL